MNLLKRQYYVRVSRFNRECLRRMRDLFIRYLIKWDLCVVCPYNISLKGAMIMGLGEDAQCTIILLLML